MTLANYKRVQMGVAVALGIIFSQAVILKNLFVPIVAAVIGVLVMLILRRRVKEIIADERDWTNGGRAALLTIQIYSWLAVVIMIALFAMRDVDPRYEPIAVTLAFSGCFLMLAYSLIFKYHDRLKWNGSKGLYAAIIALALLVAAVFGMRLISGEDNWLCQNGTWVKHGNPSSPAPSSECR